MDEEKSKKCEQFLAKREELSRRLQEEGCLASRVGPGGEISALNPEKAEKCKSLREEIEQLDKKIEECFKNQF